MPNVNTPLRIWLFVCLLQLLSTGNVSATSPFSALRVWAIFDLNNAINTLQENMYAMASDSIPWTPNKTGDNHTILLRADFNATIDSVPIELGDLIGFFYEDNGIMRCSNFITWKGVATGGAIYGNDADPGNEKNGFDFGELIQVRIYKISTAQEFAATAQYASPVSPISHTDRYAKDGISMIVSLRASKKDLLNPDCNAIKVQTRLLADTCQANTGAAIIESIDAGVEFSVEWKNGQAENHLKDLSAGVYEATLTTENGCTLPLLLEVPRAECPVLIAQASANGLTGRVQGCAPFTVNFTDVSSSEVGIQSRFWDFGDGASSVLISPVHTFHSPGTYAITYVISDRYQNDTLSFAVVVHALPRVHLGEQWGFCAGETAFIGVDAQPNYSYAWSNGRTSAMIEVAQPGLYVLTVTDTLGCKGSDSTRIEIVPAVKASILVLSEQLCPEDTVRLLGGGAEGLLWIDTSSVIVNRIVPEVHFVPRTNATYGLIASNECFTDTAFIEIKMAERRVTVSPDTCIAYRGNATLSAEGAVTYQWWSTGFNNSLGDGASVIVSPDSTGYIFVETPDSLGCTYLDSILLEVLYLSELDLPAVNIITPNGDGFNDVLEFPNLTKFHTYKLTVFNRYGAVVYESINYQNNWDGTRNGKPLPDGVYFYILRIGELELKSSLTIIRE